MWTSSTLLAPVDAMAHHRAAKAVEIAALVLICSMATIIRLFSVRDGRSTTTCDGTCARDGGSTRNTRERTVVSKSRGTDTDEDVQPIGPTWSCKCNGNHACCVSDRILPTR